MRGIRVCLTGLVCALCLALAPPVLAQTSTSSITGRATDSSGGVLPGVTVTITSPAMIGGPRAAVTDAGGVYRFTLLPTGVYQVSFSLAGFDTLNVQDVRLDVGSTMTINGKLTVATLKESVTVTSEAPTIDLEAAHVAVNWDKQKLESIPYSRSLTGLVDLVPGLFATSYDIGGSSFGTGSGPAARTFGREGGGVVSYDGMVWDQTYGDYGSYETAQVTTAAKGADAMNPGVTMNLQVKSGSNTFRGVGSANYQDGKFQSNNVSQDLLDRGYSPGVNKFTHYDDLYGEVGGPIKQDKLWYYVAYRDAKSGNFIPGFISLETQKQAEYFTRLQDPTAKLTWQATHNNKIEFMAQMGRKWQPYRRASRFVPLEATENQDSYSLIGPSFKWFSVLNQRMTFDASLQRGGYWWPDIPWTDDIRKEDLTTTTTYGAFLRTDRKPGRWQYSATYTYYADIKGEHHLIKAGYTGWHGINSTSHDGYPNQQVYQYRSLPGDADLFARPDSVQVYDYPDSVKDGYTYNALYLNDQITLSKRLTLSVGARYDRYASFLPEQGNPGTGPFATRQIYPARGTGDFPIYSTLVPRVSAVYDVTGEGRIALKASYGRYVGGTSGANPNPGPGAADVNPAATVTRTYGNWDGTIPYVPVAADLSRISGGSTNITIADGLKGPYVDEYTAGIDLGLSRLTTVSFNYVRQRDGNGNKTLNLALPYDAFTVLTTGVDPGPDNVKGTADDGVVQVYSVPRSYPTFGQVIQQIVQDEPNEGRSLYNSFNITFNKQNANGWSLLTAFSADHRDVKDPFPIDPNEANFGPASGTSTITYEHTLPEWDYALKISGTYQLPWGLQYGTAYSAQSGDWYNREVQIRNALGANVRLVVEPHAGRYDWVKDWDNRITKRVKLGGSQSLELMFDLFNTLNSNVVTEMVTRNGPTYLQPTEILAPRVFRLGFRYLF